jgi:hypothetical protein
MKKYYYPLPRPTDPEKLAQGSHLKREMSQLMDSGDVESFLKYVKAMNPNYSKPTLDYLRTYFKEQAEDRKRNGSRVQS